MNELFSLISIYIIMVLMMQDSCEFQEDGCLSSNTTTVTLKLGSMSLKVTVVVFDLDNSYKNLLNLVKPN